MLRTLYLDDYPVAVDRPSRLPVDRTGLDAGETRLALQMLRDQPAPKRWPDQ
jgi:tRNA pseudouridine65 synthase